MADTFTKWDDQGATYTSWDDVNGGPVETAWDLLPSELKIDQLAVVRASRWLATTRPARWIAKVKSR